MNARMMRAFVKEALALQAGDGEPEDYAAVLAATEAKFPGLKKVAGLSQWVGAHQNALTHGAELAGLGILAKPSFDEMRGKRVDEKRKARTELAGLGVLAAPSAVHLGHGLLHKVRAAV